MDSEELESGDKPGILLWRDIVHVGQLKINLLLVFELCGVLAPSDFRRSGSFS
jgi:hypothetical protein